MELLRSRPIRFPTPPSTRSRLRSWFEWPALLGFGGRRAPPIVSAKEVNARGIPRKALQGISLADLFDGAFSPNDLFVKEVQHGIKQRFSLCSDSGVARPGEGFQAVLSTR